MKILVLSDSHGSLSFMRLCISKIKPDHVVHLGDHYEDGTAMAEENSHIRFHQVPGNCDYYHCDRSLPTTLCYDIGGVRFLMTHGHMQYVKTGIDRLLADAEKMDAQGVLYGHTHEAQCFLHNEKMWVLNPGSCRGYSGSVGVIEIADNKISACRIIGQAELDLM